MDLNQPRSTKTHRYSNALVLEFRQAWVQSKLRFIHTMDHAVISNKSILKDSA